MSFLKKIFSSFENNVLDLPFDMVLVDRESALARLDEASKAIDGVFPVILGAQKELVLLTENFRYSKQTFASIIQASNHISLSGWFKHRVLEDEDYYELPRGDWPEEDPHRMPLSLHCEHLTTQSLGTVVMGFVPVTHSWEVPAFLKYGGWNDCPCSHEHVAILKSWEEKYGAKIACISSDAVELTVSARPTTKEEALELAKQQFIYSPGIVFQGVETIENLAAHLMHSQVWYFWWD